jgi:large subunit GTPase 1
LELYVKELDNRKRNLLLINKADLMTLEQRKIWAKYFTDHGIRYAFFSAKTALRIVEEQLEAEKNESSDDEEVESSAVASSRFDALQSGSDGEDEENEDDDQDDQDEALEGEEVEVHIDEDADDEYNEQHGFVDVGSGDVGDVQDKGEFEGDASNVHPESDYEDEPGLKSSANYSVMNEDPTRILTIDQLEGLLLEEAPAPSSVDTKLQIGLVGYPNVGKSSTINALIGAKKVSVSSTPGKTKHFQTIHLSDKIVLCDCPGLVFPNFAITNADLVCNGVLPIDQLREYTGPIQLVCQRIPKYFLEAVYGISIFTKPMSEGGTGIPTAEELLIAYARSRGFMRSGVGAPDESRAARYILKDYVNAKLQFCHPPPTYGEDLDDPGMEFNKAL